MKLVAREAERNELPKLLRPKTSIVFPRIPSETMVSMAEPVAIEKNVSHDTFKCVSYLKEYTTMRPAGL
jgi:hypothetical protein